MHRERSTAVQIDDKWVVHGGIAGVLTSDSLDDTYVFNFSTRIWGKIESDKYRPNLRGNHAAVRLGSSHIVHIGGRINWRGSNRALSTPCCTVECLRLITSSADSQPSFGPGKDLTALMGESGFLNTLLQHISIPNCFNTPLSVSSAGFCI